MDECIKNYGWILNHLKNPFFVYQCVVRSVSTIILYIKGHGKRRKQTSSMESAA